MAIDSPRKSSTYAVIQLSLSLLHLELGHTAEVEKAFKCAASILGTGIQDFWILGLAG